MPGFYRCILLCRHTHTCSLRTTSLE